METKHTPGEWTVVLVEEFERHIESEHGKTLATLMSLSVGSHVGYTEAAANAKLMAAAPELREALFNCAQHLDNLYVDFGIEDDGTVKEARKVLAKATS